MEIFYNGKDTDLHLDWEVTRGKTTIREDFSQAEVHAFLTGEGGMIPLSVTFADNVINADLPSPKVLNVGTYGVKVIWVKNGSGSTNLDEILACNKRCMSEVFSLFGVTSSQYAETNPNSDVTFHIKSSSATYGYDGLSAYERAYMLGKTTLAEEAWLRINRTMEIGEGEKAIQQCDTDAQAVGDYSFAVGNRTKVQEDGYAGFAEGSSSRVNGTASHAGGVCSVANGTASLAQGYWTITGEDNLGEAAVGKCNDTKEGLLFSVGGGNRAGNAIVRKNMLEVFDNGDIYIRINDQRTRLQDCLSLIGQVADTLITNNVIGSTALNIPDLTSDTPQPLANLDTLLGTNRVISAYTDEQVTEIREAEANKTQEEILSETQPSSSNDYYSGLIGNFGG